MHKVYNDSTYHYYYILILYIKYHLKLINYNFYQVGK